VATELGHALAERGHEVHFISYGIPFRLEVQRPNIFFHEVEVNEYPLFRYPDYTLPLSVKMAEISRAYQLDILHVHYAVPHATAAFLAQQMLGGGKDAPRVVTTLHGTDITLMSQDANYRPIIQYSIEHSCGVTAVSEGLRLQTVDSLGIKRPIEVIYNFYNARPASINRDTVRHQLGVAEEDILLIHSSNLRPVKRVGDLLSALAKANHRNKFKLLILAGASFSPYEKLVEELGLAKTVIVRNKVLDIENYLSAADIGIYPSEKESFGLSILESMCYRQPVIGSRAGGVPEVVKDRETGLLFEVGDIEAIAGGLDYLAENPALREQMGTAGKQRAEELFSTEKIVGQYVAFYQKVIKQCQ